MTHIQPGQPRLTAFCATCPSAFAVGQFLAPLGFRLVFSLPAEAGDTSLGVAPLPAQYHYEDGIGTHVEYLAGKDSLSLADEEDAEDETPFLAFPPHASRFWVSTGAQELATKRVLETLARRWSLRWLNQDHARSTEDVA